MADYVVAQAAVLIVPTLGKGTDSFQAKLKAELAKVREDLNVKIKADTKPMHAQVMAEKAWLEKQKIVLNAKVDAKQLTEIRHKYEDLAREMKKGLLLNLKVAGLQLLPQVASGLAALNASIVELSQSALLLPGIFSGIASSAAALLTGMSGLKGAFKEFSDAQKNAASEGLKARNAALNVQNAYRDLARSAKEAQRNIEDLNAQLRDAPLDEADAIIRVAEARAEAADRYQKSGLQQQKDALALQRAENDLVNVRLRNSRLVQDVAEANAAGVSGANSVREATDRLAKAQDDANTKATKLTDSLRQLSPNAQAFVQAVTGMKTEWQGFRSEVQDRLFAGLDQDVVKLAQTDLPMLQKGLGSIADSLNGNVKTAMQVLQTPTNTGFFDKIFGNTAVAQNNLSKAIDPFVDSMLRLSAAGSAFLPRLADGLTSLLTRFDSFVARTTADGSFDTWANKGIEAFKDLGNSLINIGSIMNSLAEAFTGSGGTGLLGSLESGTKKLADFLKSAEGQEKLTSFFQNARDELAKWKPVLDEIPNLISNVAAAGQAWANMLMPFLRTSAQLLGSHPGLVQAVFTAYMVWKGVYPILKGMHDGMVLVNKGVSLFGESSIKAGGKMDLMKQKASALASFMISPGGLLGAATMVATYFVGSLVSAHDAAAAAAQRQKDDVDALSRSLDEVTGSATKATKALVTKNLFEGKNEATGMSYPQAFKTAVPDDAQKQKVVDAIVSNDLNGALAGIPGATAADVEKDPKYQKYAGMLRDAGISSQDIADAVNGKPEARAKFDNWVREQIHIPGLSDEWSKAIYDRTGGGLPDLLQIQNSLSEKAKAGSVVQGEIYSGTSGLLSGTQQKREQNAAAFGRAQIPANSPLLKYGVVPNTAAFGENGAGLTTTSAPTEGSPEADAFRNDGVTFVPNGVGQFNVTMSDAAAKKYLQQFASGGMVSGPGSGTSDSILARLSHGEFVVNAAATAKHLPLLEGINSGGVPKFGTGGQVTVPVNPVSPATTTVGVAGAAGVPASNPVSMIAPPSAPSWSGTGQGTFPEPVSTREFQSAGQAQAARRGAGPYSTYGMIGGSFDAGAASAQDTVPATSVLSDVWNFITPQNQQSTNAAVLKVPYYSPFFASSPAPIPSVPSESGNNFLGQLADAVSAGVPRKPAAAAAGGASSSGGGASSSGSAVASVPAASVPKPFNGNVHVGRGGQPGPDQQRSNAGFVPYGSPFGGLQGGPAASGGLTTPPPGSSSGSPRTTYRPMTPEELTSTALYTPVPVSGAPATVPGLAPSNSVAPQPVPTAVPATGGSSSPLYVPGVTASGQRFVAPSGPIMERINAFVAFADTLPYVWGGFGPNGMDCSGLVLAVANIAAGRDPFEGGRNATAAGLLGFSTENEGAELAARGFLPGPGGPGTLTIGWKTNSPGMQDGHTAMTLPDGRNFEAMDQANGIVVGGSTNAASFPNVMHLPISSASGPTMSPDALGLAVPNAGSPSNLPTAPTPTGVQLPQYSMIPDGLRQLGLGTGDGGNGPLDLNALGQNIVTNYWEYVTNAWTGILQNFAKNGTQIAMQTLSGIFGIDLSGFANIASALGGVGSDVGGLFDSKGGGKDSGLPADPEVAALLQSAEFLALPEEYQRAVVKEAMKDPKNAMKYLKQAIAQFYVQSSGSGQTPDVSKAAKKASGGKITGRGSGTSDSILARVSNGEYIVRASAARKNMGLLEAINSGLPGFAEGGPVIPPPVAPPPVPAPAVPTPAAPPPPPLPNVGAPTPPVPGGPAPMGPAPAVGAPPMLDPQTGMPPAPTGEGLPGDPNAATAPADPAMQALEQVGGTMGQIGSALGSIGGGGGAEAPAGGNPTGDQRAVLQARPTNLDHNLPAVSGAIEGAAGAIGAAISTAISTAGSIAGASGLGGAAGTAGASEAAAAGSAAAGAGAAWVGSFANAIGSSVSGAANVLSSLMVGTTTGGTTAGAYGTPLTPGGKGSPQGYGTSQVINNWNGGVHTSNNEEFYKIQQRRELQAASPLLPKS